MEYRKLSALLARALTLPFRIALPQVLADAVTAWVLLAGVTARAQQLKFRIEHDSLAERERLHPDDDLHVEAARARGSRRALGQLRLLCVPANLAAWPLIAYAEMAGIVSPYQILHPRLLHAHLFGEGIHPDLLHSFGGAARLLFILQWLYILAALLGFFLVNALDVDLDKPGIL